MAFQGVPPLFMLNPNAGSGKAGHLWDQLLPLLRERFGNLSAVITQHPADVAPHLRAASARGIDRVFAIGGDGTNHTVINEILSLTRTASGESPFSYGSVPVGTGRDWARGMGIPTSDLRIMADWIAEARPQPVDLGLMTYQGEQGEYFLNIASAGLGGDVVKRVDRVGTRRPWTFFAGTVESILHYQPQVIKLRLDGQDWYEGGAYLIAVANGTTFGRGMKIAPQAAVDDGWLDVILVKAVSRLTILTAFQRVYSGTHLTHPAVRYARARRIDLELVGSPEKPMQLELDGEYREGRTLTFEVRPQMLQFLR